MSFFFHSSTFFLLAFFFLILSFSSLEGYLIFQVLGFWQSNLSPSGHSMLNVVPVSKPRISRSSWMRNEKVDSALPMKYLKVKSELN